jgi:hypothetical protein
VDFVLGDVDRHPGQWRWGRLERGGPWVPIAEDRDMAFVRYGGALLRVSRPLYPILGSFGDDYDLRSLRFQARATDPPLLASLDRDDWTDAVAFVQARLQPGVVADALARFPEAWRREKGAWLEATLRHRVETLPRAAAAFYESLAEEVEIHATQAEDEVTVEATASDGVDVRVGAAGASALRFERRLVPDETRRLVLCSFGPPDRVRVEERAAREIDVEERSACPPARSIRPPGAGSDGTGGGDSEPE